MNTVTAIFILDLNLVFVLAFLGECYPFYSMVVSV